MKTKEKGNAKRSYNTKGITLVALVVTIIVLIILAGVSISLVLGENGIIKKSKYAQQETLNAQVAEQEGLNEETEYLETLGENSQSSTPTIEISELEVGDYIKYNTGKTEIGDNGVVLCRVLYNDATNGLQIITEKNITQKIDEVDTPIEITIGVEGDYSASTDSYNNVIENLNNEAEKYINPNNKYIVDARCVGSLPTVDENGMYEEKDKGTENYVKLSFDNESYINSFDADENYTDDKTAMEAAGIWTTGESYWLASRSVFSISSYSMFIVREVVSNGGVGDGRYICDVYSNGSTRGSSWARGIRPCFSLKSDIKITGEGGKTPGTAYTIE